MLVPLFHNCWNHRGLVTAVQRAAAVAGRRRQPRKLQSSAACGLGAPCSPIKLGAAAQKTNFISKISSNAKLDILL